MENTAKEILEKHLIENGHTKESLKYVKSETQQAIINAMNEYKYGESHNPWIYRIITRLLMFIPWLCIQLVGHSIMLIKQIVNYAIYGGETITYTRYSRQPMIIDVFDKVSKLVNDKN
jgi:hypothetical protein